MQKIKDKNFDLSESEFEKLKHDLIQGDDALFKQIFLSQVEESIQYIVRQFNAEYNEAYDSVIETLVTFHKRIADGKVKHGNLRFLFTQMASQYYQGMKKRASKMRVVEENFVNLSFDDETYSEDQIEKLKVAWEQLGEDCKKVLKMNYYMDMNLAEISEVTNKTHASVRKQKQRCKEKLKNLYFLNQ